MNKLSPGTVWKTSDVLDNVEGDSGGGGGDGDGGGGGAES